MPKDGHVASQWYLQRERALAELCRAADEARDDWFERREEPGAAELLARFRAAADAAEDALIAAGLPVLCTQPCCRSTDRARRG